MQDEVPDHLLIANAARGDRLAFDHLVARHGPALMRLARAMTSDEATAADVVQDALLAAFRSVTTYRPELGSARTWLFGIARNGARHAWRHQREEAVEDPGSLLDLGVEAGWGAEVAAIRVEEHEQLVQAMAKLEPLDLEVLLLRDVEGMPGPEAAQVLGIGLAALKSRLHRSRLRLMAAMRGGVGGVVDQPSDSGGLTCEEVLARLGDYVDGDLAAADKSLVEAHLRSCHACDRFGAQYAAVVKAARTRLGAAPALDPERVERIRRALDG